MILTITVSFNINENKFLSYSSFVEKGEYQIVQKNYQKAFELYKSAFELDVKPLRKHSFTFLQLISTLNNKVIFKEFLNDACHSGLTKDDILKDAILSDFVKKNELEKFIEQEFETNRPRHIKSLNKFLIDSLNQLSKYDNKWKIHYLDSLAKIDVRYGFKYDSIIKNLVEGQLIPLIKEYGYPGERLVGADRVGRPQDPYDYSFVSNKALFILLHYYSFERDCTYNNLFLQEVKKGNMLPREFASIMDFQYRYSKSKKCANKPYNQWHESDDSTKFDAINLRRKKIGLEDFRFEKKKYDRGIDACYEMDKGKYKHIKLFYWCG